MAVTVQPQLAALADLRNYRVCAEDTDPRGWSVVDAMGVDLGSVSDLIIDVDALTARYIVCSLMRADAQAVLIPTGFARFDNERQVVHLDFITAADVDRLPAFTATPVSAELVADIERILTGVVQAPSPRTRIVRRGSQTRNAS